jgi:hypothetical protein
MPLPAKPMPRRLKFLKALAGALMSFGIDDTIDDVCKEKLAILPSNTSVGVSGLAQHNIPIIGH